MRKFKLTSISVRLFAAVAVLCAVFFAYAAWSISAITAASSIVKETYDRPLQALNYARSANATFYRLQLLARENDAAGFAEADTLFIEDLGVARERSLSDASREQAQTIETHYLAWREAVLAGPNNAAETEAMADDIAEEFDILTETMAAASFLERQRSVDAVDLSKELAKAAAIGAGLLALVIAGLLSWQIVKPLSVAAAVANRISEGDLSVAIPAGRDDETGALLRSMQVMQNNINEMIQREEARANSAESRMVDALDRASAAIILFGADGRIIFANEEVFAYFPAAREQFREGASFRDALVAASRELQHKAQSIKRLVGGDASGNEFQLKDGRWLRAARSKTRNKETVLIWTDVTSLKEREERLEIATTQARAASAAKSRFLSNISHELKTPLNAIIGFSDIIKTEALGPIGSKDYKDYARYILDGGRRLLEIVQEVLEIARDDSDEHDASRNDIVMEPVNLSALLEGITQAFSSGGADVEFQCDASGNAAWVWGNADLLTHALRNIVSNAVKFTEGPPVVRIVMTIETPFVMVKIKDNGVGMRPEDIPIALSAFEQADGKLNRRFEGAGIGLPFAKSVIERHGGELDIKSALGKGTLVIVRLFDAQALSHGDISIPSRQARVSA